MELCYCLQDEDKDEDADDIVLFVALQDGMLCLLTVELLPAG
jgi:hypothetical protein